MQEPPSYWLQSKMLLFFLVFFRAHGERQGEATCVPTNSPTDRWHQRPIVEVKMPKGDPSLQATIRLSLLTGAQSLRKRDEPAQLPDLQNYEYKEMTV